MAAAPRARLWLRTVTAVLAAVPTALAALTVVLSLLTLDAPARWVAALVAVLPPTAAWIVRRRLLWFVRALPALRDELRRISAEEAEGGEGTAEADGGAGPAAGAGGAGPAVAAGGADPAAGAGAAGPETGAHSTGDVRAAADEVDRTLRDRVTVRNAYRLVRWVRSPRAEAAALALRNLGPRAGATAGTATGALERVVGLAALTWASVWGTAALGVGIVILLVVAVV